MNRITYFSSEYRRCFVPAVIAVLILLCCVTAGRSEEKLPLDQQVIKYNTERFRKASDMIHGRVKGKSTLTLGNNTDAFREALLLFQENISETPDDIQIDQDYALAMECAAKLRDYKLTLQYYRKLREDAYGWITKTNAHHNWDKDCKLVREELSKIGTDIADEYLQKMLALDEAAAQRFRIEAMELLKQVQDGNEIAAKKLNSIRYQEFLVKLIAEGELILTVQPNRKQNHNKPNAGDGK